MRSCISVNVLMLSFTITAPRGSNTRFYQTKNVENVRQSFQNKNIQPPKAVLKRAKLALVSNTLNTLICVDNEMKAQSFCAGAIH